MRQIRDTLLFSASDLVGHLECRHLTALDAAVARGETEKPKPYDPLLQILAERGLAHERAFVDHLRQQGHTVVEIAGNPGIDQARVGATMAAMRTGAAIIVQGAFMRDGWAGRTDILRRVERPSAFGAWSYEVIDTKLARKPRAQPSCSSALYSDLLSTAQGRMPEYMHVVTPGTDFSPRAFGPPLAAYYRQGPKGIGAVHVDLAGKKTLSRAQAALRHLRWRQPCDARRRADDHLCLVAGITKVQIAELRRHEIPTTTALAATSLPLTWKPDRGAVHSYERVREQARIQVRSRAGKALYETLAPQPELGLARLPSPPPATCSSTSKAIRSSAKAAWSTSSATSSQKKTERPTYCGEWALLAPRREQAFERFVDFVMKRWAEYPDLHIYHYAPYEPARASSASWAATPRAKRRSTGCSARSLFVDLYQVVRHGIRASVESYSIKRLEPLYRLHARARRLGGESRARDRAGAARSRGPRTLITDEIQRRRRGL